MQAFYQNKKIRLRKPGIYAILTLLVYCVGCAPKQTEENRPGPNLSKEAVMTRWPSPDDNAVIYNGPATRSEGDKLKKLATRHVDNYLKSIAFQTTDQLGTKLFGDDMFRWRGEVGGYDAPIDHTLETPLMTAEMITSGFVTHVQKTLLREKPKWRLHVVGTKSSGEESVMVYPDAVRVGDELCPPDNLESTIESWKLSIQEIRDKTYGAQLRQFLFLQKRVPALIEIMKKEPVVFIAAFDNWHGERDNYSVWFLQRDMYLWMPVEPEDHAHGDFFGVDSKGRTPIAVDACEFYLCQWNFPPAERFEIVFREFHRPDGFFYELNKESNAKWSFPVEARDVISDEQLKQWENGRR